MSDLEDLETDFPPRYPGVWRPRKRKYANKAEKIKAKNALHKHRMLTNPEYRARYLIMRKALSMIARYLAAWEGL